MSSISNQLLSKNIDKNSTLKESSIIRIKLDKKNKSASCQLSARPTRSFIKSKSLLRPMVGKVQK